jgi:hypothetical protein
MVSLIEIKGIGPSLAAVCVKSEFSTIAKIAVAKPDELSVVPGISKKSANLIIDSARSLLTKPLKITVKEKKTVVAPVKVGKKAVAAQTMRKSPDKAKKEPDCKPSKKLKVKSSSKEKKMSASGSKEKIKKLKKKIKNLKAEKKEILSKEAKKLKKAKDKKSSKKK